MSERPSSDVTVSKLAADLHRLAQQMLELSDLLIQALADDDTSRVNPLNDEIRQVNAAIQRLASEDP